MQTAQTNPDIDDPQIVTLPSATVHIHASHPHLDPTFVDVTGPYVDTQVRARRVRLNGANLNGGLSHPLHFEDVEVSYDTSDRVVSITDDWSTA